MKKTLSFILVMILAAGVPQGYSQAPLSPGAASPAVGVVAAVSGPVRILSTDGPIGKIVESGAPIRLGDEVSTGPEGQLQILLMDETVFTIGPESSIVIDAFVYDPVTNEGKIEADVLKGLFRLVTGNIARRKPENVKINLPSGSVGIRGTILYGSVEGDSSFLLLLGPGEKNNTGHRQGAIVVENQVDGKVISETVSKSGYGSEIPGSNLPPAPAFKVPEQQVRQMTSAFTPKEKTAPSGESEKKEDSGQPAPGSQPRSAAPGPRPVGGRPVPAPGTGPLILDQRSAAQFTGEDFVRSLSDLSETRDIGLLGEQLTEDANRASQDLAQETFLLENTIARWGDLSRVETGKFVYEVTDAPFIQRIKDGTDISANPIQGTFSLTLEIDFGQKKVGVGDSEVSINTMSNGGNISSSGALTPVDFGQADVFAVTDFSADSGKTNVRAFFENRNGVAGAVADFIVTHESGESASRREGVGAIADVPRTLTEDLIISG